VREREGEGMEGEGLVEKVGRFKFGEVVSSSENMVSECSMRDTLAASAFSKRALCSKFALYKIN
jgi:hypothetical protein